MKVTIRLKVICAVILVCLVAVLATGDTLSKKELLARIQPATAYTPGKYRIINVADFGAVGDKIRRPLATIFDSQEKVDEFYGKGLYLLTDELDYVAFCEALRAARGLSASINLKGQEVSTAMPEIYLPNGKYNFNRTVMLDKMVHCTIRGAGRQSTQIYYTGGDDLFLIQRAAFLWFKDMSFFSEIKSKSTIFHLHDMTQVKDALGIPTMKFLFDNLEFSGCYRGFYVTGEAMGSEVTVNHSRWQGCLIGIHLNNWMAYNWNLFNCDFEARPDNAAAFAPYKPSDARYLLVEEGGAINIFGGSVIHPGKTLYIMSKNLKHGDNFTRSFFNFYGVKWEQHGAGPSLFDGEGDIYANINFDGCSGYQSMSVSSELVKSKAEHPGINGRLVNGMNVSMNNCQFTHGEFVGEINERTKDNYGSLVVRNTRAFTYREQYSADPGELGYARHNVSYQPNCGYKKNDIKLFMDLYKVHKLTENFYPDLSPSGFMAFDIPANETCAVGIKRVVKQLFMKSDKTSYSQSFPKVCTLSSIMFSCESKKNVTITITRGPDKLKNSLIQLTPQKPNIRLGDIEIDSNTPEWDGVLEFSFTSNEAATQVKIVCEYF